jgi:hypothetical protein
MVTVAFTTLQFVEQVSNAMKLVWRPEGK